MSEERTLLDMLLQEPARTPYDLEGHIFGVPWRIHWHFWPLAVLLGIQPISMSGEGFGWKLQFMLIWVACVLVSIMLHELGHVWAGMSFGRRSHIVLYSFGGLAVGAGEVPRSWQRIIVFLAGPAAQFALCGVLKAVLWKFPQEHWQQTAQLTVDCIFWINLIWAALNLLPIFPLDGGQVSLEIWNWFSPNNGLRYAMIMSIATALLLTVNSIAESFQHPILPWIPTGGGYTVILYLCLAGENYLMLRRIGDSEYYREEPRAPWERDPDFWKQ
jgi:stage IV sporulation protein FB